MTDEKQTTRDKVEAWLKAMPKEILLTKHIHFELLKHGEVAVGEEDITLLNGYELTIKIHTKSWEEDGE